MPESFILHQDFSNKFFICDLPFCRVLLEPVREFYWIILIPRVNNAKNILDLSGENKAILWDEINKLSEVMNEIYKPDQLNIAMLGNKTPQLHCHIIARFADDSAFPNATFGHKTTPSSQDVLENTREKILQMIFAKNI